MFWDDISSIDAQYRLLTELSNEVAFRIDAEGCFEWVSPAVERVTGWTPEELVGRTALDVVPPQGVDDIAGMESQLLAGQVVHYRGLFRHANGLDRWTEIEVHPVLGEDGVLGGTVGVAYDVHDAEVAQQALVESEAHYRLLADHASDVVVRMTPDLIVEWVSPSVEHVLGWKVCQLIGTDVRGLVHPSDLPQTLHRGTTSDSVDFPPVPPDGFVLRIRTADGRHRWMSSRPRSVHDDEGREIAIVANWTDVQDLVEAREAARVDHVRLKAVLDSLVDPHVLLEPIRDVDGVIVDFTYAEANPAALANNRVVGDDLIGARLSEVVSPESLPELLRQICSVLETGQPLVFDDYPLASAADTDDVHRFDIRLVRVSDQVSITWRDVTDRHVFEERLSELALHDPLTGLANRAALLDEMQRSLVSGRRSNASTALLMLDLDRFKFVNDTHGHGVGDQLLVVAADRLRRAVRAGDLVARLGGDEFVVVMRDLTESKEAFRVAARVVDEFRDPIRVGGHELLTTASLGIAISTETSTPDELMREADVAMYRAKESGRDRYAAYNEALRAAAGERVVLEQQLRPALGLGELVVFFQPEVDLMTGEVCGVEALLRWHHQSGELFLADRFIDLAEESGLMVDIGRWVMREACRAAAQWTATPCAHLRTVYLNLSKAQLGDVSLVDELLLILAETGVSPELLCVEITETALEHAGAVMCTNMVRLHDLGVRLAIDDFGSGDAALSHLRDHRVDAVKIDRSFIGDIDVDPYSRRLLAGIAALAKQLGLAVVAEGVETVQQATALRDLGCATAHGYLFAGAVPVDEFPRVMVQRHHID